jgi:hypothetical protein
MGNTPYLASSYVFRNYNNTGGAFTQNSASTALYIINDVPGVYDLNPGTGANIYGNIIISAPGSNYRLTNDLTISNQRRLTLIDGILSLNGLMYRLVLLHC